MALVFAAMALAGCQTYSIKVLKVERKTPAEIASSESLAPMKLERIGIKLRRGTPVGEYKYLPFVCIPNPSVVFWNQGRVRGSDLEFIDIFYEEMANANFNVVGNPNKMFEDVTVDSVEPRFVMGGQIEEIKMELCERLTQIGQYRSGITRGKGSVKVKWQLFSLIERKVVFETTTWGATDFKEGSVDGELVIIADAFAEATANLAADEKLVALLSAPEPSITDIRDVDDVILQFHRVSPYRQSITENIDRIRLGAVTIDGGAFGHGSGFFISPTYILTNFHVVRNSQFVRITLVTGRKILGEVVRRHPQRDVAVIQVELSGNLPIPIRSEPLKITEEVYAIGSPLEKEWSGTVTRGIVSKFTINPSGMEDIQADVDIQGGNSGGPLLDAHGNVVGISYAGRGPPGQFSAGVNFFIPIMDAMDKLNLGFKSRKERLLN